MEQKALALGRENETESVFWEWAGRERQIHYVNEQSLMLVRAGMGLTGWKIEIVAPD